MQVEELFKMAQQIDGFPFRRLDTSLRLWGSDFDTTRLHIEKKAKQNTASTEDTPITVFGNKQLYVKCHQEYDLTLFIYVYLKYGNMSTALAQAGTTAEILKKKLAFYEIESEIALSSIAKAFPVHTARLILNEKFQGVLTYSAFFKQELPLLMQHAIFPALIPIKHFKYELTQIALYLNVEISVKVSLPEEKGNMMVKTVDDLLTSSNMTIFAAIYSQLDPQDEKLEILTKAGILEFNSDGELQLSAATVALLDKTEGMEELKSLKYSEAVNM